MRRRTLLLAAVLAVLSGARANGASAPAGEQGERARGNTFSVPVPKGFSPAKDERVIRSAPGGVVLIADARAASQMFLGSIVVTRIGPGPDFDPSDAAFCRQAADGIAAQTRMQVTVSRNVEFSAGSTCQWETVDKELSTRGAIGTVMYKTRDNSWVVTCNFDTRDARAQDACGEVLRGWTFD
jgi:hypothetical protein